MLQTITISSPVFPSTSNTMDVILTDAGASTGSITYRTTGGIFDFLFFAGPSPLDITRDLSSSLGFPALPPYWGLGFHLCRWGYKDVNETAAVVAAMRSAQLPHDVMWNDIDYMNESLSPPPPPPTVSPPAAPPFKIVKKHFPGTSISPLMRSVFPSSKCGHLSMICMLTASTTS